MKRSGGDGLCPAETRWALSVESGEWVESGLSSQFFTRWSRGEAGAGGELGGWPRFLLRADVVKDGEGGEATVGGAGEAGAKEGHTNALTHSSR